MNILYLDDYINLYIDKKKQIYIIKPYKDTLKYGVIINKNKFINKMKKELLNIGLINNIFKNNITIIINNFYKDIDKEIIKEVLEELNFKAISFVQESKILNNCKKNILINCNYSYFYVLYTDFLGNLKINVYNNDLINKELIVNIFNFFSKKEIYLYGKNVQEFTNILDSKNKDYFIYEGKDNLIIKKIINDKI